MPDYALGPHTASLGLVFYRRTLLPARYRGGAFVGQHGSWNRKPPSGYKVIFVPFANGRPRGPGRRTCSPAFSTPTARRAAGRSAWRSTRQGALLVADDVGNTIWRVTTAH